MAPVERDEGFACLDAATYPNARWLVAVLEAQRRLDGPEGIVVVRSRRAEDAEERVGKERLAGAAQPLDDLTNAVDGGSREPLQILRVGAIGRHDLHHEDRD